MCQVSLLCLLARRQGSGLQEAQPVRVDRAGCLLPTGSLTTALSGLTGQTAAG